MASTLSQKPCSAPSLKNLASTADGIGRTKASFFTLADIAHTAIRIANDSSG